MSTNRESEAGRRGLFAIFFFAFAVPFALTGFLTAAGLSYRALVSGPDPSGLAFDFGLAAGIILLGPAAFGACLVSLLAAGKWEARLVRILWVVVALTTGMLTATLLFG